MTPKNGASGRSTPHGSLAILRSMSMRMMRKRGSGKSSGSTPIKRQDRVVGPVLPQLDRLDANFKHMAGLRAFDKNRAGEDMRAGAALGGLRVNFV